MILLDVPLNYRGFAKGNTFRPGEAHRKVLLNSIQQYYPIPPRLRLNIVLIPLNKLPCISQAEVEKINRTIASRD